MTNLKELPGLVCRPGGGTPMAAQSIAWGAIPSCLARWKRAPRKHGWTSPTVAPVSSARLGQSSARSCSWPCAVARRRLRVVSRRESAFHAPESLGRRAATDVLLRAAAQRADHATAAGLQPQRGTRQGDSRPLLEKLQAINDREPSAEKVYALAELAFLGAKKAEEHDKTLALDLYGASVLHAYEYLFDAASCRHAEPLRSAVPRRLRSVQRRAGVGAADRLREQGTRARAPRKTINTAAGHGTSPACCSGSRWRPEDFERFEFVSDYEIKGLKNHYQTHGLGVPLIAVRRSYKDEPAGGPVLSARAELPRDGLPAAAVRRSTRRPARSRRATSACWNCTIR